MKNTKQKILFFVLGLFICGTAFAQTAVTTAIDNINKNIILNDYEKAYSGALFLMKYYAKSEEPISVENEVTVERAVTVYFSSLDKSASWDKIVALKKDIPNYNDIVKTLTASYFSKADVEIQKQKQAELDKQQQLEKEAEEAKQKAARDAEDARLKAERDEAAKRQQQQLDSIISMSKQYEFEKEQLRQAQSVASAEQQKAIEELRQQSEAQYREELTEMVKQINETNSANIRSITDGNKSVTIVIVILACFVFLSIALLVLIILRHQKLQAMQFQSTMETMRAMRTVTPTYDVLSLPFQDGGNYLPDSRMMNNGQQQLLIGSGSAAPSPHQQVVELIKACEHYGVEIDKVTGRKNAARLVADVIYKISRQLGYGEEDSVIFFAVGLVYDIGFLNIDPTILRADFISKEQFEILKTHTQIGLNMVFFVDESWRELFRDGVSKHHENLDGSGYPNGLKDDEIPYIARVIHVAESYIALISRRDYKEIKDRNSAIAELKEQSAQYDEKIVNALDEVV